MKVKKRFLSWHSGAMRTKRISPTGRLQAKEATAGNDRVKALNDPAAEHGVSQPILQRLHLLEKTIYPFLPGKRVNFALQYVFLTPHKKYCNACPNKT